MSKINTHRSRRAGLQMADLAPPPPAESGEQYHELVENVQAGMYLAENGILKFSLAKKEDVKKLTNFFEVSSTEYTNF